MVLVGFGLALPFIPLYLQELGLHEADLRRTGDAGEQRSGSVTTFGIRPVRRSTSALTA